MSKQYKEGEGIGIDPVTKEQLMLYPMEQLATLDKSFKRLTIGIPKETNINEKRVSLRPTAVQLLSRNGHTVVIETQAGTNAKFEDHQYSDAGAKISYHIKEVWESDIVLKIEPPTVQEIEMMKPNSTLISTIHMAYLHADFVKTLLKKRITAVSYEFIEDKEGSIPIVRAMSEIAGSTVMLIAAEYLSSDNDGKGIILGGVTGVPPTKVVIIGAGTVAEHATRTAKGLGAEVKVFAKYLYKLRRLKYAVGHDVFTSVLDEKQLKEAISRADVLIGAIRPEKERSPVIVTEEMVASMKPNSVIIDVSIDQGGCIETSEITTLQDPIFKKYDVIHYCVPNIASKVARTSSTVLSNIFTPYLLEIGDCGGIDEMIFINKWFMKGVYTYKGNLTNAVIAKKFNMPHKDLGLLMAARW
jgi:alanine dehydrogenase